MMNCFTVFLVVALAATSCGQQGNRSARTDNFDVGEQDQARYADQEWIKTQQSVLKAQAAPDDKQILEPVSEILARDVRFHSPSLLDSALEYLKMERVAATSADEKLFSHRFARAVESLVREHLPLEVQQASFSPLKWIENYNQNEVSVPVMVKNGDIQRHHYVVLPGLAAQLNGLLDAMLSDPMEETLDVLPASKSIEFHPLKAAESLRAYIEFLPRISAAKNTRPISHRIERRSAVDIQRAFDLMNDYSVRIQGNLNRMDRMVQEKEAPPKRNIKSYLNNLIARLAPKQRRAEVHWQEDHVRLLERGFASLRESLIVFETYGRTLDPESLFRFASQYKEVSDQMLSSSAELGAFSPNQLRRLRDAASSVAHLVKSPVLSKNAKF